MEEKKSVQFNSPKEMPPIGISVIEYMTWYCFQAYILYDKTVRVLIPKKNTELDFDSDPDHIIVKINSLYD
jgi:hypothetical protein